ncbi:MAG: hypothetical protein AB1505_00310 [Candidatus Latescibacterota bacterium]
MRHLMLIVFAALGLVVACETEREEGMEGMEGTEGTQTGAQTYMDTGAATTEEGARMDTGAGMGMAESRGGTGMMGAMGETTAMDTMQHEGFAHFSEWDRDGDLAVTRDEFEESFAGRGPFADWDMNKDGHLDQTEFSHGARQAGIASSIDAEGQGANLDAVYERWDTSQDDQLQVEEFRTGLFAAWDTNSDGKLAGSEFGGGQGTTYGRP